MPLTALHVYKLVPACTKSKRGSVSIRAERLRKGHHSTNLDIQKCCESGFYPGGQGMRKKKKRNEKENGNEKRTRK
jgi:hypothetical protein